MLRTSLVLILVAAPVWASAQFPGTIKTKYSLAAEPPCAICHTNGITGIGTVNTPFGTAMRMHGLVAGSDASLNTALDAMAAANVDSDGDGVTDVDELKAGHDPNVFGPVPLQVEPAYGCASARGIGLWGFVALAVLFWIRTRRRRGSKR